MKLQGLQRVDGVMLSGPALRIARDAALIACRNRRSLGLPAQPFEQLARELNAAMSADGQTDVRVSTIGDSVDMPPPTVAIDEAARRLGVTERQARRLAPRLGGRKLAGRWLVTETALREHLDGRQP